MGPAWMAVAAVFFVLAAPAAANTYTVSDPGDLGPGTLAQAITDADLNPGADDIAFALGGQTIALSTQLPAITDAVTIDDGTAGDVLDGSGVIGLAVDGLTIDADGVTVNGLTIQGFSGNGIAIAGSNGTVTNNVIHANGGAGVTVTGTGTGDTIQGNAISSNGGLGIDLGTPGADSNDAQDTDSGPNGLQNYPVLTAFTTPGATSTVSGTLNSTPSATFQIDFYGLSSCDGSGHGEGDHHLGSTSVTTDASGDASITGSFPAATYPFVAATATAADGSTSEFSACQAAPTPQLSIADVSAAEGSGKATFTISTDNVSASDVTVHYATSDGTAKQPGDYTATSGTATIPAGQTSTTVDVPVVQDSIDEPDETFNVNLTSPTNATIADATGMGTIVDDDGAPSISINDRTVTEGDAGTTNATFTVSLSQASGRTITVDYATGGGTATAGSDYTATSGTLTFNPGDTSKTIDVPVVGDTTDEPDETFNVNLTNPSNATISDAQGLATITDDDAAPSISVDNPTVTEGNSGTTPATFHVTLSAASGKTVTVHYATSDGSAAAPSDYTALTDTTLTFTPGQTSKTVTVNVNGDTLNEDDETFHLDLTNPSNATILDNQGTGTITNDDAVPTVSIGDKAVAEGDTGTTPLTFTVTLSAPSGKDVTVHYATSDGTATAPSDYAAASGTATIPAGQTSTSVTVNVNGDTSLEADETFHMTLSSPSGATIADGTGTGTILDDDGPPGLSVGDATQSPEGNSGTTILHVPVTLLPASGKTVTVDYATSPGTAASGADYTATSGTLTFVAGETSKDIAIPIVGDTIDENDETFTVTLSTPTNATIKDGTGTETITDDDNPPTVSVGDASVAEGNSGTTPATFTVALSQASGKAITVNYTTSDDSATQPSDYAAASGTLTFNPGETSHTVTVNVTGDTAVEPDEAFHLNLSSPSNATIADGLGVGTISNDDAVPPPPPPAPPPPPPPPSLRISDAKVSPEGNSKYTYAHFTVSLSTAATSLVTVHFATANVTATAQVDYTGGEGTVSYSPGQTAKVINVPVYGDKVPEPTETFGVDLSQASGATVDDGHAVGTIVNDDRIGGPGNVRAKDLFCGTGRGACKGLALKDMFDRPGRATWVLTTPGNGRRIVLVTYRARVRRGPVNVLARLRTGARTRSLLEGVRRTRATRILVVRTFVPADGPAEKVTKSVKLMP